MVKLQSFFETTDNCPTCKQNISQEIKDSALSEAKIEAKSLQSRLTLIKDEYDGLVQDIDNWNHNLGSVRERQMIINSNNNIIRTLQNSIQEYQDFFK